MLMNIIVGFTYFTILLFLFSKGYKYSVKKLSKQMDELNK